MLVEAKLFELVVEALEVKALHLFDEHLTSSDVEDNAVLDTSVEVNAEELEEVGEHAEHTGHL